VSRHERRTAVTDLPQAQETLTVTPTTRPWRARALAVIAAVLAALAVWLVTDPLLGVELAAPIRPGSQQLLSITPALVAATSLVAALAGWGLLALLERFTTRPRTSWTAIAVGVGPAVAGWAAVHHRQHQCRQRWFAGPDAPGRRRGADPRPGRHRTVPRPPSASARAVASAAETMGGTAEVRRGRD
jgi:hypothetical protein